MKIRGGNVWLKYFKLTGYIIIEIASIMHFATAPLPHKKAHF
jgi:hypothetical protein